MTRVLIVERPGAFRDELLHEVSQRGVEAHVRDDAMDALASIERLSPQVVLVSDDPGPPGALGLCRVLQRKLSRAQVYRIGEPSLADQLDERSVLLPRAVGAAAVAAALLDTANDNGNRVALRVWEGSIGSLELGPLLLAIQARWLTGRLVIVRPGTEREISFARGMPVHARSTVLSERTGALAVRRGLLSEPQVEQAADYAQARGIRIGVAMMELGLLDAAGVMRLLSTQLLEQLTAACNSGSTKARFVLDHSVISRYPLLRMTGMTALLHAVVVMPDNDVTSVLDELGPQPVSTEPLAPVERWLADLQLQSAVPLTGEAITCVHELRDRLREVAQQLPELDGKPLRSDAVALALLRSGVFRMRELVNPTHADLRAGVRTLSPPSLVNAAVRCAQSDFTRWPLSPITRARTPLDQAIDVSLHGSRTSELARALAVRGPEVDCDGRFGDVYSMLLGDAAAHGLLTGEPGRSASLTDLRLHLHGQLKRLDELESQHLGGLCRAHLLQTRDRIERSLALLPVPENAASGRPLQTQPRGDSPRAETQEAGHQEATASPVAPSSVAPSSVAVGRAIAVSEAGVTSGTSGTTAPGPKPSPAELSVAEAATSPALERVVPASPPPPPPPKASVARVGASAQERALLEAAEPLLEQGRWRDLRMLLAPDDTDAVSLPPVLALLYAVSLKEDQSVSNPGPGSPRRGTAESIAITVTRQLFDLPDNSAVAVMLAKRLLRRPPLDWKQKPPARVSAILVASAVLIGAMVGFLLQPSLLSLFWK